MADQNVIAITGRIGQDPELRYTSDGSAVLSFSIANGVYKKGAGEYNQLTTWYRCTVFGARAETINNLIRKGSRVGVTGQHSMRPWTDKEGNERLSCEINYCEVTLLDGKSSTDTDSTPSTQQQPAQRATATTSRPARNVPQPADSDDNLPF